MLKQGRTSRFNDYLKDQISQAALVYVKREQAYGSVERDKRIINKYYNVEAFGVGAIDDSQAI